MRRFFTLSIIVIFIISLFGCSSSNGGKTDNRADKLQPDIPQNVTITGTGNINQANSSSSKNIFDGSQISVQGADAKISLQSIDFIDANNGWVIDKGNYGQQFSVLLKTRDGGRHWEKIRLYNTILDKVCFTDQNTGWAIAHFPVDETAGNQTYTVKIMKTSDGGKNWDTQFVTKSGTYSWCSLWFQDNSSGYAITGSYISDSSALGNALFSTSDGGNHWSPVSFGLKGFIPQHMSFSSFNTGWVIGIMEPEDKKNMNPHTIVVLKTNDGGKDWKKQFGKTYTDGPAGSVDIDFTNPSTGWFYTSNMATWKGDLYYTDDAGNNWKQINQIKCVRPTPTQLDFTSPEEGWIPLDVGAGPVAGGLMHTSDGGKSFDVVDTDGESTSMKEVDFISSLQGWAVGTNMGIGDYIIQTADGGKTWTQVYPALRPVKGISFIDSQQGFGLGQLSDSNALLYTADGGNTWENLHTFSPDYRMLMLSFADRDTGWVLASPTNQDDTLIFKTTDGGITWSETNIHLPETQSYFTVYFKFFNEHDGLIIMDTNDNVEYLSTDNGGAAWQLQKQTKTKGSSNQFSFISGTAGWNARISNDTGSVDLSGTTDGKTWQPITNIGANTRLYGMYFLSPDKGWALTEKPPYASDGTRKLQYTSDGGKTWSSLMFPSGYEIGTYTSPIPMQFTDELHGFILTANGLLKTDDGGKTWTVTGSESENTPGSLNTINITDTKDGSIQELPPDKYFESVSFVSSSTGYLSEEIRNRYDNSVEYKLLRTDDAGSTWKEANHGLNLSSLQFTSENTGFAIENPEKPNARQDVEGNELELVKTTDAGLTWNKLNAPGGIPSVLDVLNDNTIFMAVSNNVKFTLKVYKTTDGGSSWLPVQLPAGLDSFDGSGGMSWVSENEGYLLDYTEPGAGQQIKTLYYTKDGGKNWEVQSSDKLQNGKMVSQDIPAGGYGAGILFFPDGTGFLGEMRGTIYKTDDGGRSFKNVLPVVYDSYPVPDFINTDEGFAIVGNNTLIHTKDGGSAWNQLLPVESSHTFISFSSGNTGIGVFSSFDGHSYLDSTEDGGKSWTRSGAIPADEIYHISLENGIVWAMVSDIADTGFQIKLIKSEDRGADWQTVRTLSQAGGSFCFSTDGTIYLPDYGKGLFKSPDNGKTWEKVSDDGQIWNMILLDDTHGLALKEGGTLVYTDNAGKLWTPINITGGNYIIDGIHAIDSKHIFIEAMLKNPGGNKYSILYSADGGLNFKSIIYPKDGFSSIEPVNSNLIYALYGTTLYISSDGGMTFRQANG